MRPRTILHGSVLVATLAGCAPLVAPQALVTAQGESPYRAVGHVDFGTPSRAVAAVSISDIAAGATVSLIDTTSGNTLATTLTDSKGDFVLTFSEAFKPDVGPYYFEAVKGIGASGPNQVGYPTIRVRTLGSFDLGWKSMSPGSFIVLNRSTTALCALASLKNFSSAENLTLLGSLTLDSPSGSGDLASADTYNAKPGIAGIEFLRARDLVNQALDQDTDPIGALFLRPDAAEGPESEEGVGYGMHPGIAWASDGAAISRLEATAASIGQTLSVYGQGFPTDSSKISVTLGTKPCEVTAVSTTEFRITIPSGASSGQISVKIGRWTLTPADSLTIH